MKLFKEFYNTEKLNEFIIKNKLKDYEVEIFKCRNDKLHQSSYNIPDSVLTKEIIIYVLKYNLESKGEE